MHNYHATYRLVNPAIYVQPCRAYNGVQVLLFVVDPMFQPVQFVLDCEQRIPNHVGIPPQNQQKELVTFLKVYLHR